MRFFVVSLGMALACGIAYAQPLDAVVAEVNEAVITQSELDKQFLASKQQLLAQKMSLPTDGVLRKQVLQHLIDVTLQLQFAKNNNIHVDDDELDDIINSIAQQNRLNITQMQAELNKVGMSWQDYRDNLKKEITMTRLQQAVLGRDIHISESQVDSYLKDAVLQESHQKKYHVLNILIPLVEAPTPEEVAAAKQKALVLLKEAQQGADFSKLAIMESSDEYALEGGDLGERYLAELPEVFVPVVKAMQVNEVSQPIRTGNGWQLIKLLGVNEQELHHQITKTHVKHILIKSGPQMTDAQAEHLIQNIYRQVLAGKSFDILAKRYSVDAATAVKGGDMGWVVSNELVPQFSEVMDKLSVGGISSPVKTPFGWHIMQVLDRKVEDDSQAYQRQKIRMMLQQKRFTEAVKTWQQHLRTMAFVHILDKSLI